MNGEHRAGESKLFHEQVDLNGVKMSKEKRLLKMESATGKDGFPKALGGLAAIVTTPPSGGVTTSQHLTSQGAIVKRNIPNVLPILHLGEEIALLNRRNTKFLKNWWAESSAESPLTALVRHSGKLQQPLT
ncbi:hypothetical protein AAY473_009486 [Plecturocebus cupreus]